MDSFTRRLEIIRILVYRRKETMEVLAGYFGVTVRTIQNDIDFLSLHFPIETVRGRYGCVKILDTFHPFRQIISIEQKQLLEQILLLELLSEQDVELIRQMVKELG